MNGGEIIARVLLQHGVAELFTLCGGHISPILVAARAQGIRVIDTRHEATAVFAADAVARLTGRVGVAAVTAGPGVTNTVTAVKNAQMAHSPLVLLGGATATLLKGRGALQDVDQLSMMAPHVKSAVTVSRVKDIAPALEQAFYDARSGVPGPVFVELPVDVLYDEAIVRQMVGAKTASEMKRVSDVGLQLYLRYYLGRTFSGTDDATEITPREPPRQLAPDSAIDRALHLLDESRRPVLLLGSPVTAQGPEATQRVAAAVDRLGIPTYLSGMARGLLGQGHDTVYRHKRKVALKESDCVILCGVPVDFRLNYGMDIGSKTPIIAVHRGETDVRKNRRPKLAVVGDPADFIWRLSRASERRRDRVRPWHDRLRTRERERDGEIADEASRTIGSNVNPLALCLGLENALPDDSVLVADGGDFVATAAYTVQPRSSLSWLDPGPFGTLGAGAGFALGAKICRPDAEVWLLYGDGSAGYSIAELDTFVRHQLPIIALVGNDASWGQIARDQIALLGDDVGTKLARTAYHTVAQGFGAAGRVIANNDEIADALAEARRVAAEGIPFLLNAHLDRSEFRKGSISM